jgi:hypothetical protein
MLPRVGMTALGLRHWRILADNGEKPIHLCNTRDRRRFKKETLTGFDQVAGVIGIWDLVILAN